MRQRAGLETGSASGFREDRAMPTSNPFRSVARHRRERAFADRACPSTLPLAAYPAPWRQRAGFHGVSFRVLAGQRFAAARDFVRWAGITVGGRGQQDEAAH